VHGVRIGSVAGIELRVDWSVVVIFWLLTWDLAAFALPSVAAGYPTAAYWAVAVVATGLFLVTLGAHEMSHSVVARRRGIEVRDITLWMLGGISTIKGTPKSPRDDLAIAVAGPAASAAIGIVGVVLGVAFAAVAMPRLIVGGILWVAMINFVLAVFNLAPAAPLDGGRILRAWLWHRSGDRFAATVQAARAGMVFAWVLMTAGFAEFALGGGIGGLWLLILGWFVFGAARAEQQQAGLEHDLGGLRVRDVMTPCPTTAPDSVSVARLIDEFVLSSAGSAFPLIGSDGRVSGLVTLNHCKVVPPAQRDHVLARDIAEPVVSVPRAMPDDTMIDALNRTSPTQRRLLVFDGDDLVGIVTPTDIMRIVQRASLRHHQPESHAA
jgi:Zn-dependent protease